MTELEALLFGDTWLAAQAKRLADTFGFEYTPEVVKDGLTAAVSALAGYLASHANALVGNLVGFLFDFVILVLITFFVLTEGPRFRAWVFRISPLPDDEDELLYNKFTAVGRAIMFGSGAASVGQGVIGGVAMALAGVPSPVLWGTVMAIAAFLPLVGISVVYVPASIYLALQGRWPAAILFAVFCFAQGFFFENVLKTKMIGSQMRMHDLLIFLSVLGGMSTFGFIGLLYGPLLLALFLALTDLYEERYQMKLGGGR
jgi:predicted PurR-regulated permease PerM